MNSQEPFEDDSLRRLFQASGLHVEPSPEFEQSLLEQMKLRAKTPPADRTPVANVRKPRRWIFRLVTSSAAAAVLLAMAGWYFLGGGAATASADFAQMLRNIRQCQRVTFDKTTIAPGMPATTAHVMMQYPGQVRFESADGKISIHDYRLGLGLIINPKTRKAQRTHFDAIPDTDPLEDLRRAHESSGRLVGAPTLEGRKTFLYEVAQPNGSMRVWVEPQQNLPIRLEVVTRGRDGSDTTAVYSHFEWNVPIDPAMFRLDPPAGFELRDDYLASTPESLAGALLQMAEMDNGRFPSSFNILMIHALMQEKFGVTTHRTDDPLNSGVTHVPDGCKPILQSCLTGLKFAMKISDKGSWRYAGKGVMLWDASSPVCAWKAPGESDWHVMYGDFAVRTQPQLPPKLEHGDLSVYTVGE